MSLPHPALLIPARRPHTHSTPHPSPKSNWSQPTPRIYGSVKSINFPSKLDIIFRIPGTHLCLMHSPKEGTMCCWDILKGSEVSNTVFVAKEILEASHGRDEPGRYSRALLAGIEALWLPSSDLALIIVTVSYDDNEVRLEVSFQQSCDLPLLHYCRIFLHQDVLGVLRSDLSTEDAVLEIVAFNTSSRACSIIITDIPSWRTIMNFESQVDVVFTRTNMLLLFEQTDKKRYYRCPLSLLPFGTDESSVQTLFCVDKPGYSYTEEYTVGPGVSYLPEGILGSDPIYGILAASVVSVNDPMGPRILIKFWGLDREKDIEEERRELESKYCISNDSERTSSQSDPKAHFPLTETTLHISGELQQWSDWLPFKLAHGGQDMVLVVTRNKETFLQLVRFYPITKQTTVHDLGLPCPVETKHIEGISLDEHLGVVTLVDRLGSLYAISFA
ncbi:hypothetical protein BDQ17DRAFT_1405181 [Cyathus striatus]|nr:hypothetical protein BDQ17DRAFT_1405181 [Cyathus striatus]